MAGHSRFTTVNKRIAAAPTALNCGCARGTRARAAVRAAVPQTRCFGARAYGYLPNLSRYPALGYLGPWRGAPLKRSGKSGREVS